MRNTGYFAITICVVILLSQGLLLAQAVAQPPAKNAPAATSGVPSEKEISEARAKGLVWTNPTTKVYHKDGEFYGRTRNGKFMSEADAVRQYYRPSPDAMKKVDPPKAPPVAKTAPPAQAKKK